MAIVYFFFFYCMGLLTISIAVCLVALSHQMGDGSRSQLDWIVRDCFSSNTSWKFVGNNKITAMNHGPQPNGPKRCVKALM